MKRESTLFAREPGGTHSLLSRKDRLVHGLNVGTVFFEKGWVFENLIKQQC